MRILTLELTASVLPKQYCNPQPLCAGGKQSWEARRTDESGSNYTNNFPDITIAFNGQLQTINDVRYIGDTL